jgi:hypothetical protein
LTEFQAAYFKFTTSACGKTYPKHSEVDKTEPIFDVDVTEAVETDWKLEKKR